MLNRDALRQNVAKRAINDIYKLITTKMNDQSQSDMEQSQVPLPPPPPQPAVVIPPSVQTIPQQPVVVEHEEKKPDTPGGALCNMGCSCLAWALAIAGLGALSGAFSCSFWQAFLIIFGALLALGLYFLPSVFAFSFRHPYRWPIMAVNLFFGCTAIGWVIAFIWSFVGRPQNR